MAGMARYLAGGGLAAIRDGKLLFSRKSTDTVRMTCFDGGACAGRRRGPDVANHHAQGQTLFAFATPDGEPIVAPPAIGGDGSVWVATEKAVYAAR